MCSELNALRQSIVAYATGFDARELTPGQAGEVVRLCAQMEASIASVKALAAARCAEGDSWRQDGYRSAADQLAAQTGTTPSSAKRTLATGKRMSKQPEVAQAALAGQLSPEQAAAVSDGAAANPAKAQELIDKAQSLSVSELNDEIARAKAAAADLEARRQAIRARRYLRRWTDRDGAFHAHLQGLPEHGAGMWQALDPIRRRLNHLRRSAEPPLVDSFEALDYDALLAMTQIALGREDELSLVDLIDLGLFPQLQSSAQIGSTSRSATNPSPSTGPSPSTPPSPSPVATPPASGPVGPSTPTPPVSGPVIPSSPTSPISGPVVPSSPTPPVVGPSPTGAQPAARPDLFGTDRFPDDELFPPTTGPTTSDASSSGLSGAVPSDPRTPAGAGAPPYPVPNPSRRRKLAGSPIRVTVMVDLDTLLRGYPIEGETCEIPGYGPIPVSAIEDLMAFDNVFVVGALTKSKQVIGTYHQRRRPDAHQKSGLDTIYPSCAVAGCNARIGLQYDHRADWSKTHYTVFDLLDRLCPHHHALKTQKGWLLVPGRCKRAFVAPTDPRYPRNSDRPDSGTITGVGPDHPGSDRHGSNAPNSGSGRYSVDPVTGSSENQRARRTGQGARRATSSTGGRSVPT